MDMSWNDKKISGQLYIFPLNNRDRNTQYQFNDLPVPHLILKWVKELAITKNGNGSLTFTDQHGNKVINNAVYDNKDEVN